jgi:acyl carrier protein
MDKFYERLAEQIQVKQVHRDDVLQDFPEWDSLTILSIVAMIGAEYGVQIGAEDLATVRTAGDLEDLVRSKKVIV